MASIHVAPEDEMTSTHPRASQPKLKVITFINNSSGSGKGDELQKMLGAELGAENVYIFGRDKPGEVIERIANEYFDHNIRVIVGGGDGSVNWVLSVIHQLGLSARVAVGIIPNGTGNDTSRYLGWGQCQFGEEYTLANVRLMKDPQCPVVDFDRWQLFFSLKKDTMIARTAELRKSGEVPDTHLLKIQEKQTHLANNNPSKPKQLKSQLSTSSETPQTPLVDHDIATSSTSQSSQERRQSIQIERPSSEPEPSIKLERQYSIEVPKSNKRTVEIFLPKFYRSMLRLTELQFTERYKLTHSQHWPPSFDPVDNAAQEKMLQILEKQKNVDNPDDNQVDQHQSNSSPQIDQRLVELRQKYSEQLEKQSKWLRFSWSFNNYFSFGIDAQAMNYFGIHRDNNPCCYQCRLCTMSWIAICSATTCVRCQKKPLRYRIDILYKETDLLPMGAHLSTNITPNPTDDAELVHQTTDKLTQMNNGVDIPTEIVVEANDINDSVAPSDFVQSPDELEFHNDAANLANGYKWLNATFNPLDFQALVLLNIPSYAGGRNIWGAKDQKANWLTPENQQEQKTDDGSLESVAFTGFNQMQFTVLTNSSTYRLGQIQGLRLYLENDAFVQLDGEAWIQPRGVVEIFRSVPGKMLKNPNPDYPCC